MNQTEYETVLAVAGLSRALQARGMEKTASIHGAVAVLRDLRKEAFDINSLMEKVKSKWQGMSPTARSGIVGGVGGMAAGGLYDRLRPRERWEEEASLGSTLKSMGVGGALGGIGGAAYGSQRSEDRPEILDAQNRAASREDANKARAELANIEAGKAGGMSTAGKTALGGTAALGGAAGLYTGGKAIATGAGKAGPLAFLPYLLGSGESMYNKATGNNQAQMQEATRLANIGRLEGDSPWFGWDKGVFSKNTAKDMWESARNPMASLMAHTPRLFGWDPANVEGARRHTAQQLEQAKRRR